MVDNNFLSAKVESLLSKFAQAKGPLRPPIDPVSLADFCAVLSVEHRPMVPEGVLTPVQGGFILYLQSNFSHLRGAELRQRFTIAHELVHTFYYDVNGGVPKRTKGAPKGQTLERLCHLGAGQILVPKVLLRQEVEAKGEVASAESILDLLRVFDVSAEVLIRRLHEVEILSDYNFAAILVETVEGGKRLIRAACYGPALLCHTIRPKYGLDFDQWVRPLLSPSASSETSEWIHVTRSSTITARKVDRSSRSFILDLTFGPPSS